MRVIDSHTEGEPTRVIVEGGPELGGDSLEERVRRFQENADEFRRAAILAPRGSEALVGALLCEPADPSCAAGVIFFNNVGYLGMCGHGALGVAVTLAWLGRISRGAHRLETPVGVVRVDLADANLGTVENVPSFRHRAGVCIEVEGLGIVTGDVAWGGNWFFLVEGAPHPLTIENVGPLTDAAANVRQALREHNITGADGAEIDHIEFFGPPQSTGADSRNFVLCPGGEYDRSPCGTGTSAKLACLAADGKLKPGEPWVQESVIDSRFTATYREDAAGRVVPRITGRAWVTGETRLILDPGDPLRHGVPARGAT